MSTFDLHMCRNMHTHMNTNITVHIPPIYTYPRKQSKTKAKQNPKARSKKKSDPIYVRLVKELQHVPNVM